MDKDTKTRLTDELTELSKKQTATLDAATYLTMSKADAKAFDKRGERIGKIRELLTGRADE